MRIRSPRMRSVKLFGIFVAVTAVATVALFDFTPVREAVSASVNGPSPSHTNAPLEANCTACHADFPVNSGTGSVAIGALPANYLPGQQVPITVTTSEAFGVVYGFQLTAIDSAGRRVGTYTIPTQTPAQLQVVTGLVGP